MISIKKIKKFLESGWKGISVFVFIDLDKEPQKLRFNLYTILFPILLILTLFLFLVFEIINEKFISRKNIKDLDKTQILLYNFFYSTEIKKNLINKINHNFKIFLNNEKSYKLLSNYDELERFLIEEGKKIHQYPTRMDQEIFKTELLKKRISIFLDDGTRISLFKLWHIAHIYYLIPKGIPMYDGTFSITSGYGNRQDPFQNAELNYHSGIDFAASQNTPILASTDGRAIKVNRMIDSGYGIYVILHHGLGFQSLYAHCSSILVEENQNIKKGDIIALIGKTGRATGNHLHYEVRIGMDVPVDPLAFIKLR